VYENVAGNTVLLSFLNNVNVKGVLIHAASLIFLAQTVSTFEFY